VQDFTADWDAGGAAKGIRKSRDRKVCAVRSVSAGVWCRMNTWIACANGTKNL